MHVPCVMCDHTFGLTMHRRLCRALQGLADGSCQPGATWQPFVMKATFPQVGPPNVVAVSNYTWCATRSQQKVASQIVSEGIHSMSNSKIFRVGSKEGVQLMLLNTPTVEMAAGLFRVPNESGRRV